MAEGRRSVGSGRGKLILCGEHAVVYGHPAIAVAVDRHTSVHLVERPGPTAVEEADLLDERLVTAVGAALPLDGLGVRITTNLPIGRGMGSSAALAVALVRAEAGLRGEALDDDTIFRRAFAIERVFHGNPSGLDHAVSIRGGVLWYVRADVPVLEPLPTPPWQLVVLDSGIAGDTAALVARVAARRPAVDLVLEAIAGVVHAVRAQLSDAAAIGPLLTENHRMLRDLGVSTPALDALVDLALSHGAHGAKLAGAGGGGVVLAVVDDPEPVLAAAETRGIAAFATRVAAPGFPQPPSQRDASTR